MPKLKRCSSTTRARRATTRSQTCRERRNNGVQLSESTATTRLQPTSQDSPIASMSEISNTTQQHTPCLEFSTAVLSTSDISDSLPQQQHAAGLGTAASDFSVLSMSAISNNFQHSQEHASGFELSISTSSSTSDNLQHAPGLELSISTFDSPVVDISNSLQPTQPSLELSTSHSQEHVSGSISTLISTSDNLQHAQQHAPGLELNASHSQVISMSQSDTTRQVRGQSRTHHHGPTFRALNYAPHTFNNTTNIGSLTVKCTHCNALKFTQEAAGLCCANGKVVLHPFPQLPHYLQSLYDGSDLNSVHFLSNIRRYNSAFQMTSFGCNEITMPGFNPSFTIQGQVYHRIGSLCPPTGDHPKFCQIYFMDNITSQVTTRCNVIDGLVPEIVQILAKCCLITTIM